MLFFCFKVVLAIWSPLQFHMSFEMFKIAIAILIEIALNLYSTMAHVMD